MWQRGANGGAAPPTNAQAKGEALSEAMVIAPRGHTLKEETQQSNKKLMATSSLHCGGNLSRAFERACMVRAGTVRTWRNTAKRTCAELDTKHRKLNDKQFKNLNRITQLDGLQSGTAKKTKSEKQKALALSRKKLFSALGNADSFESPPLAKAGL